MLITRPVIFGSRTLKPENQKSSKIFLSPLDNLVIDKNGVIYLADLAISGITAFDPKTGKSWEVTAGSFTVPLGMAMTTFDDEEAILIADPFGYRFLDPKTAEMTREPEMWSAGGSSSVAANEEFLFTTYTNYNAVRKIDRETNEVVFMTTDIQSPRGIVLTSAGDAIIADTSTGRLVRLVGEDIQELATGLEEPVALLLESDSSVLVSEIGSGTISRVDVLSGKRTELVSGLVNPLGLALLNDGRVVVVEPKGDCHCHRFIDR